jgi:ABC-type nitrate/sulfonate/bicarbonate transport system permease component
MGLLNVLILPAPSKLFFTAIDLIKSGELFLDVIFSLKRVLVGFFIAAITGIPLGLFLGINKNVREVLSPIINFIRPIPPIAWIPLAILWFGVGDHLSYFITMIAAFFPIFLNTLSGVDNVSKQHLDVAKCFGATKFMILIHVIIPASLPHILSGIRVGLGFAWMAVVAAEMVTSFNGLGYLITVGQQLLRLDQVIVGMITIGLLGLLMDNLIVLIKNKFVKWSEQ